MYVSESVSIKKPILSILTLNCNKSFHRFTKCLHRFSQLKRLLSRAKLDLHIIVQGASNDMEIDVKPLNDRSREHE